MQQAVILGEGRGGLVERPRPSSAEDVVLVKVHVTPMCTEYKAFKGGHPNDTLGHEAAGEVVEVAQPGKVRVGDRVVVMPQSACGRCALCLSGDYIYCQHSPDIHAITGSKTGTSTYAQYLLKQDWLLVPIPDDMSFEHASMACCGLGPTFGAMQRLQVNALDTILITGMGPVGLGGVINAWYRGCRVIAVESQPYRANLARELGAEAVIDPADPDSRKQILALTGGVGADKAIDCSGAPEAHRLLIDALRRRGQMAFVGEGGDLTLHVSRDMLRKGLTLHGSWHFNFADSLRLMQVIRASTAPIDRLITHRFPMSRVQEAWELQITGNCGKVLLDPWAS
jgi:L-iditol 2-dehydrogenase